MDNCFLPSIVSILFDFFNKKVKYAILRNYEGLPFKNKSRDIDILINKSDFLKYKKDFIKIILDNNYKIVSCFQSERIHTFVIGRIDVNVELLQFDFFFNTSAYGNILILGDKILDKRKFNNFVYHVPEEYEFLDKYLYLKYIGAQYPLKYNLLKEKVVANSILNDILKIEFGISKFEDLDKMESSQFLRIVKKRNIKKFLWVHLRNRIIFIVFYLGNIIFHKGFSIAFTGPDGVGKTTIIDIIKEEFSKLYGDISLFHFRPLLIGNLGEVAHNVGLKKEVDREYTKPHRGRKVGVISSLLRLCYYTIDYILGYYKLVKGKLFRRNIVIFDRYYTDVICDSRRSRIFLNYKFLFWFGKVFIPRLDYNVLLTARTETILGRKQELTRKGIEMINDKIDYLSTKKGYKKVMNDGTAEEAVTEILGWVFEEQHKRNLKRLK